jgi:hypothetical protein
MQDILIEYEMLPTTWFYVSSLLIIGIFFKFQRFFCIRNLDLVGLLTFSPGLLLVAYGKADPEEALRLTEWGYAWVFFIGTLFLIRLLVDQILVRRPLLEPNLNASGLTFTGIALVVFLMANVITNKETPLAEKVMRGSLAVHQSGYESIYAFANLHVEPHITPDESGDADATEQTPDTEQPRLVPTRTIRTVAVLSNLALVLGIVFIGYRHFGNFQTGVAAASLYLLLPYTSQMTGRVDYVVPALLLVWAVAAYRRPIVSGILIGLAAGCIFYPLFLLPLWFSFYWKRGIVRFLIGLAIAFVILMIFWLATSGQVQGLGRQLIDFSGIQYFDGKLADGLWADHSRLPYRIPIIAGFAAVCGSLALWPAQKHLGTLISCTALVMLGTQFWHPYQGGLYMGWYLPLLVLTVFRPNLEDRVALTAVPDLWRTRRRAES